MLCSIPAQTDQLWVVPVYLTWVCRWLLPILPYTDASRLIQSFCNYRACIWFAFPVGRVLCRHVLLLSCGKVYYAIRSHREGSHCSHNWTKFGSAAALCSLQHECRGGQVILLAAAWLLTVICQVGQLSTNLVVCQHFHRFWQEQQVLDVLDRCGTLPAIRNTHFTRVPRAHMEHRINTSWTEKKYFWE